MAQLSTIISSILRDIVVAQHEANMYAMSLEDVYKQNGRLERFSLPTVAMGEVELDLHYAIADDSAKAEQYEINYPQLRKLSLSICNRFAIAIVAKVLPLLQAAFSYSGADEAAKVLADLAGDKNRQKEYSAFLSRKFLKAMQESFTSLVNEDGTINEKILQDAIMGVCDEFVLHHEDLSALFGRIGGSEVRDNIQSAIRQVVDELMPTILKDVNLKRKRILPSVDVVMNANELAGLPEECIHTLHFHVSPGNIKLYSEE